MTVQERIAELAAKTGCNITAFTVDTMFLDDVVRFKVKIGDALKTATIPFSKLLTGDAERIIMDAILEVK